MSHLTSTQFIRDLTNRVAEHNKKANDRTLSDTVRADHKAESARLSAMIRSSVTEVRRHNPKFQR